MLGNKYYKKTKELPESEAREWIGYIGSPEHNEGYIRELKESVAGLSYLLGPCALFSAAGGILSACGYKEGADFAYAYSISSALVWPFFNIDVVFDIASSLNKGKEYLGMRLAKSKLEKEMGKIKWQTKQDKKKR